MKLSKEMENYMEIALEGKNSLTVYGALKSFIPQVKKLEKENEELRKEKKGMIRDVMEVVKEIGSGEIV